MWAVAGSGVRAKVVVIGNSLGVSAGEIVIPVGVGSVQV